MEDRFKISMLLDVYGKMLTDKQRDIMTMYFNDDLSLSEISEMTCTSRQAAYDIIKRCQKLLMNYEDKLKVKSSYDELKDILKSVDKKLCSAEKLTSDEKLIAILNDIKKDLDKL